MTTFVLYVFLRGMAPDIVSRHDTFEQCERERALVHEVTKTSTTVYKCKEE